MSEISVIIPLYNKAPVISRALDSIFKQSFQDFEIIVVDDGSTDRGAVIVAEQSDRRIKLIKQTNAGPGAARNRGMAESRSRYVAFLDADDEWLPDFLKKNLASLEQNPTCAAVFCRNVQGPDQTPWSPPAGIILPAGAWHLSSDCTVSQLFYIIASAVPSAFGRREALMGLGGFYENRCLFGEDIFLWLLVALNHGIFLEKDALVVYHTEDSELNWYHQKKESLKVTKRPLNAWLLAPEIIRAKCPTQHSEFLEKFLAFDALSEANNQAGTGEIAAAVSLGQRFPKMRAFKKDYAKLQLKIRFPKLGALMRGVKQS